MTARLHYLSNSHLSPSHSHCSPNLNPDDGPRIRLRESISLSLFTPHYDNLDIDNYNPEALSTKNDHHIEESSSYNRTLMEEHANGNDLNHQQEHAHERKLEYDEYERELKLEHEPTRYTYPCRCGSQFEIVFDQLEQGVDVIGCSGCGEWIGVEYEEVMEQSENGEGSGEDGEGGGHV